MILRARQHVIEFPRRPMVMGIVNINDDSFCGDGTLDPTAALAQAEQQLRDGADIIDIGATYLLTSDGALYPHNLGVLESDPIATLGPGLRVILAYDFDDHVSVLENNGDGTFAAPVVHGPVALPTEVLTGDLNRDDIVDDSDFQLFVLAYDDVLCP